MSHLVQTDDGDVTLLDVVRLAWNSSDKLRVHLVKATWTPVQGTVPGDMTEADYPGYAYQLASGWTAPTMVGGKAQTAGDPLIFTRTSTGTTQTIYGYWTESLTVLGKVVFSQLFDTPIDLAALDDSLVLWPVYTLNTEFTS